jgi:hypothetical protein
MGKKGVSNPVGYDTPNPFSLEDDNIGLQALTEIKDGGWLWLAVDGRGDDFYSTEVRPPYRHHDHSELMNLPKFDLGIGDLWTDGVGPSTPLSIEVGGCQTMLDGFYWDQFNASNGVASDYEVCIYLTLEIE